MNVIQDLAKALDVDRGKDNARLYLARLCRAAIVFINEFKQAKWAYEKELEKHVRMHVADADRKHQAEIAELNVENNVLQEQVAELHDKVYALEKRLKRMKGLARESKRPSKPCS